MAPLMFWEQFPAKEAANVDSLVVQIVSSAEFSLWARKANKNRLSNWNLQGHVTFRIRLHLQKWNKKYFYAVNSIAPFIVINWFWLRNGEGIHQHFRRLDFWLCSHSKKGWLIWEPEASSASPFASKGAQGPRKLFNTQNSTCKAVAALQGTSLRCPPPVAGMLLPLQATTLLGNCGHWCSQWAIIPAPHCRERKGIQREDMEEANCAQIEIHFLIYGQITTDTRSMI